MSHYAQLRIDQKESYSSDTFAVAVCKCEILNRSDRLFYPLILYGITRLCKLPNRSDGLFYPLTLDGLFTCYASYQIGQRTLLPSATWRLARYAKYPIGQLTLDSFFAISKRLSGDHRHRLHTAKISANIWSTCLVGLICRHHSDFCFKEIGGRGPIAMMMIRLTRTSGSMI